ncbi:MAG: 3,4-dehydroadipyl-CoA semialdehyde dehydrogenase [Myxococcota bacterium]|jgi:3,4-dehydroadipyl-CoA semialdehyde dehydrogenase
MKMLDSFLEGRWVSGSGRTSTLYDPTTEEAVAQTCTEGLDLGGALEFARQTGGSALKSLSFAQRGELLAAVSKAVHGYRDELCDLARINGGNTRGDAKFDIDGGTGTMMYYAKLAASLGDKPYLVEDGLEQLTRAPRYVGRHLRTPLPGVAVHINAFNFPAWGLMEKAAVALLAGVPVVAKPATSTALVAHRIMQIIAEADILPAGALSLLCGSAGDLLDQLQLGDAVAFTGSSGVGNLVRQSALGKARVNVEADSLNAVVLGPDVDDDSETWELFLREAAKEMTQKTGQKCTATRRIFVPKDKIEQVAEELGEHLSLVRVGNPALREVRMGPLATEQQFRDVRAGVGRLSESCAVAYGDGGRGELTGIEGDKGWFMSPVVLVAPDYKTPAVHADEVFGPVSTLLPYSGDPSEALEGVRMGGGGLVASVYTDRPDFAREVVLGLATWSGRVTVGSARVAEHSPGPGVVMPQMIHGGPGRAGGGEELGGQRGLSFYLQRTAVQGSKALLEKILD